MQQSDGTFRARRRLLTLSMYWIRGVLYGILVLAGWYMFRPVLPFLKELAGDRNALVTVLPVVVLGPFVVGWLGANLLNVVLAQRNVLTGMKRWEDKIVEELAPDSTHALPVVLAPFPSAEVRSLAILTDTYKSAAHPGGLASVYIPRTPRARTGALRVVPADQLIPTEWTLQDFVQYHWSYGSGGPELFTAEQEPHDGDGGVRGMKGESP